MLPQEAAYPVENILQELIGPVSHDMAETLTCHAPLFADRRTANLLQKARSISLDLGMYLRAVPLNTLIPTLESAARSEEQETLNRWAALLVHLSVASRPIYRWYVDILADITVEEARLLENLARTHDDLKRRHIYHGIPLEVVMMLDHFGADGYHRRPQLSSDMPPTVDRLNRLAKLGLVVAEEGAYSLSQFGQMFLTVCRPPEPVHSRPAARKVQSAGRAVESRGNAARVKKQA